MKNENRKVSNVDIHNLFAVPLTTLQEWKDRKDYRKNIYDFFKKFTYKELKTLKEQEDISKKFIAFLDILDKK